MLDDFLKYDKTAKIAFIDMETENLCLSFIKNRPWETALLRVVNDKIIKETDCLTKWPNFNIGEGAAMVTGFRTRWNPRYKMTMEDALHNFGEKPEETFKKIKKTLDWADYILGQNLLGFDLYLIIEYYKMLGENWKDIPGKIIDTNAIAKGIKFGIKYKKGESFLAYQYSMTNTVKKGVKTNLTFLGKEFNIDFDYDNLHDSCLDLRLNLLVWNKLKWQLEL